MNQTSDDQKLLEKRFRELSARAERHSVPVFSEFLGLYEQDILSRLSLPAVLEGGYPTAERKVACFGGEKPPIRCIEMRPVNQKFADTLTHRDFLGSLMGLGLRRETLGDIIIEDNCGFLFCLEMVSEFICTQLETVRHTTVKCHICNEIPDVAVSLPEPVCIIAASERTDALIAAVFGRSRAEAQKLFAAGRVFAAGRLISNTSYTVKPGEMISVRGLGRFILEDEPACTRKGRLRTKVRIFR